MSSPGAAEHNRNKKLLLTSSAAITSQTSRSTLIDHAIIISRERTTSFNDYEESNERKQRLRNRALSSDSNKSHRNRSRSGSEEQENSKLGPQHQTRSRRGKYGSFIDMYDENSSMDEKSIDSKVAGEEETSETADEKTEITSSEEDYLEEAASFRNMLFRSEDAKVSIKLFFALDKSKAKQKAQKYDPKKVFPDWILKDPSFRVNNNLNAGMHISHILQMKENERNSTQTSDLVKWLMSVWPMAATMGFKRVAEMLKVFKHFVYPEGENIVVQGDQGSSFYIIISGMTTVIKEGIGIVARLGMGKSFGEVALFSTSDIRTATVRAEMKTEVICMHKLDYDRFIKDVQTTEKREEFLLFRDCKLFRTWNRAMIDRMVSTCVRKSYEADEYIIRQDAEPDYLYLILEGLVHIIKEITIVNRNKWPISLTEWKESSKSSVTSMTMMEMAKGDYFGELAILKHTQRAASAVARTRVICVCIGKEEFLHILASTRAPLELSKNYMDPANLLQEVTSKVTGGPSSTITYAGMIIKPKEKKTRAELQNEVHKLRKSQKDQTEVRSEFKMTTSRNSREEKFAERFYKEKVKSEKRENTLNNFRGFTIEALRISKARAAIDNNIEEMNKYHSNLGGISKTAFCKGGQKRLSFDSSIRRTNHFEANLPDISRPTSSSMRPASSGSKPIIFEPLNRKLVLNKGMTIGATSRQYHPLTAAITDRLVSTPNGRLVRDKTVINLVDVVSEEF